MAIPASGPLSISQFNTELGRTSTTANSQLSGGSTPQVGSLVRIASATGPINVIAPFFFSNWYGYTQGGIFLVGTSINTTQSTGSTSITLPTLLLQNDLVFIMSTTNGTTPNLPTGYTAGGSGASGNVGYRWSYKRMGVTPDTTATGLTTGAITIAFVYRNVNLTTIFDAAAVTSTGAAGMPNAATRTSTTNNSMFVALGFLGRDAVTATAPANYTLVRTANYANGTSMVAQRRLAVAGASDPAAFGGGGDDDWAAVQFALRPV